MRQRLSATYTVWQKMIVTLLVIVLLFTSGAYGLILGDLPDFGLFNYAATGLFLFFCYRVVSFLFREKTVLEFDNENLYIISKKQGKQKVIPLENILRLNMSGRHFDIGNYWFYNYTLLYLNSLQQERRVSFFMRMPSENTRKFVELVKARQPAFYYKNWTHSFDLSD